MRILKLLRDPLLHFVVVGAVLFAGYELINGGELKPSATDPVHIGEGEIRWLKDTFANQWQRPPTEDELRGLVAGFLEEELFAREAKALGLDQNDTIVRRRLAQKLTFLIGDTLRIVEPTNEELRRFHDANPERFQTEARVSFTQLFFNPERRQHPESDARAALVSISATGANDAVSIGDPILLEQVANPAAGGVLVVTAHSAVGAGGIEPLVQRHGLLDHVDMPEGDRVAGTRALLGRLRFGRLPGNGYRNSIELRDPACIF